MGRLYYSSSRGHEYLLVVYDYDSNVILVEPLKSRQIASITTEWNTFHSILSRRGVFTSLYVLDNEISSDFCFALKKNYVQLLPLHNDRHNAAESAIRT